MLNTQCVFAKLISKRVNRVAASPAEHEKHRFRCEIVLF